MSLPYVGEIRLFAGNFAPVGWAFCDGQLLAISQNEVLFNLIGTTYGGDGQTTYALPDLRGRVPLHQGQGSGTSNYVIGQNGGVENVAINAAQMPSHTHGLRASTQAAKAVDDESNAFGSSTSANYYGAVTQTVPMDAGAFTSIGSGQAHNNMGPFTGMSFIISLFGVYPTQN